MSFGTWLFTKLHGEHVGTDAFGNRYYIDRRTKGRKRERRWVMYKGSPEASKVPAEWHAWLHYTVAEPLPTPEDKPWVREHQANLTGTPGAYLPPGHDRRGGVRAPATGDYEAWQP